MINQKGFYITTAIVYPNSRMHVGFGWEVMGADMVARFHRMLGRPVFFATGADEHSQNVEKAAHKVNLSAQSYCDQMSDDILKVMQLMDIAYDRYIRTSDKDHEIVSQYLISKSKHSGDVYKQAYEGLYCDSCEVFYTEKEIEATEGKCPTHKQNVRKMSEENYFFKLSKYEPFLKDLFKRNPKFLEPESRRNEVLSFIEQGLKDFSVSRTSFKWGIPLPFDEDHVIYVWFDALINYLTAIKFPVYHVDKNGKEGELIQGNPDFFKKFWPCDIHVIGKDITRFHCIYWPAMLQSTGIELPSKVWAHGFIEYRGEKMSKTRGVMVTPDAVIQEYGVSALRWYLLSGIRFDGDGEYSEDSLVTKCNADLANNIGNLVNRVVNMSLKYFPESKEGKGITNYGTLPLGITSVGHRMNEILGKNGENLVSKINSMDLSGYCGLLIEFSMAMNKFIDETKPWSLAKNLDEIEGKELLATVLSECLEGIRNLAIGLWPVIPQTAIQILEQCGLNNDQLITKQLLGTHKTIDVPNFKQFAFNGNTVFKLQTPKPLFARLEVKQDK